MAVPWLRWSTAASHLICPSSMPGQSMWELWWRVALGQVFPLVLRFFPISIILTVLHAHLLINSFINHSAITNTTKSLKLTALLNKTHKHTQTSLSQHSCPGIVNCMSLKTIGLIAIF